MTTERQRQANRQNSRRSTGPKTAEGKAASRINAIKHGLSGGAVFDESELKALTESAMAVGYSAIAAEEVARAVLEHRRVMRSYHEVYTQDQERYVNRGRTRRHTVDDLIVAYEAMQDDSRPLTPHQQMIIKTVMDRGQLGDVMRDTTGEYLLGLERYLRRSSSRVLKAVRLS